MACAERERYRHYVVTDAVQVTGKADPESLLAVLTFSEKIPVWLAKQLGNIRRVETTTEGSDIGGEWITAQAYWRDTRGGRSVWIEPEQYQFGAAALTARKASIARRLEELDKRLGQIAAGQSENQRQLKAALDASKGYRAIEQLAQRQDQFEQARRQLPQLREVRIAASHRWTRLDREYQQATNLARDLQSEYKQVTERLRNNESAGNKYERDWNTRKNSLVDQSRQSRVMRARFPTRWIRRDTIVALQEQFRNATQARLRGEELKRNLDQGEWEKDDSVEERHTLMMATVSGQKGQLLQREASNEAARVAVDNARERYIDVLRSTVRRYRKNIVELGQLAGVEVSADLPHLDNDDNVLRQAELKVNFNFDGKGRIGMNDGEASGGQQVIKSLILLVGLLKDEETAGGFVFIDEPFAHLDVRNIQLVGHFLKSTRAQYVLTTPITHNVEVFEPADITLVTSKKPPGARWAPPIGVLQRRPSAM